MDETPGIHHSGWRRCRGVFADDAALIQAFADVATIAILHAGWISPTNLVERTRSALAGRTVIEQAKGALAYRFDLDLATAFDALVALARDRSQSLSVVATEVLGEATRLPPVID